MLSRILHHTLIIVCCFAAALLLAWKLLQQVDYGYAFWYEQLEIAEHIQTFAPQNRLGKTGFEQTDAVQHHDLFSQISHAVNNSGDGLRTMTYRADDTDKILLTDAEATHLEDVAKLIDRLVPVGWVALLLLVLLLAEARFRHRVLPGLSKSLITLAVLALVVIAVIAFIGPHEVFKALHEAVFPAEHQWFFYYQDSLMTTLMKAPDIFFAIAVAWAVLSAAIYLAIAWLMRLLKPPAIH